MTVFRSYLKILKKFIPIIIIYTIIFILFAVITTKSENSITNFQAVVPDVAIINNDKESKLLNTFINYISKNAQIVDIENNEDAIQDALFFRRVSYVLIIPENYTNDLLNKKNVSIEIKKTPDGYSTYTELMIQRFIKIVDIYAKTGMNEDEICKFIVEDLKYEAEITIDSKLDISMYSKVKQYYNLLNYVLLSLCILIISEIMTSFKDEKIRKRNLISSTPYKKIIKQFFLGNFCVILALWALYVIISVILYKDVMLSSRGILLILNSLIFSITAAAIGFLIATIVKSREAINGIVNVVALGLSFISGAFVPQKYLGDTVLNLAKIFPSYWFITNNSCIVGINEISLNSLRPIIINMGIVALYAIIYFIIIKIYNKKLKFKY